jgi:hypothetical protein
LSVIALASLAHAQTPSSSDPLSGKFEGMVNAAPGVDTRLTLEITINGGKVSGRFVTPQGASEISKGKFERGKLTLKFGTGKTAGRISARLHDDKLTGEWIEGKQKRSIELSKVPVVAVVTSPVAAPVVSDPAPVAAPAPAPVPVAAVSLAGDWDAVADAQGGFPFTLSLKVDGEKVTGDSSSSLGAGTISNGIWKDGKLVFQLDTPSGAVAMSAVMQDGGLVGEFDFAGQLQGRWVAKKRTP